MNKRRAFFYVQHLLGIGHLKRAVTLARAMVAAGLDVTLASGGPPVPDLTPDGQLRGVRFVQLPPASAADLTFKTLLDGNGRQIDAAWKRMRGDALLAAWRAADPHVLVLELFPFGRRQMRFELLPLLDAAAGAARRPAIACSVRDVLGSQQSPQRQEETLVLVERYFDRVLVHGDPGVIAFDRTFSGAGRIAGRIEYTGYVVDAAPPVDGDAGQGEVIVSAGGGAVGAGLLESAIRAKPLTALRDRNWRVLAGNNLPDKDFQKLARLAAGEVGIELERSRPDFTTLLSNCALSISQAGYNTLMETIRAGARAVVVPFAGGQETEQTLRARCFAERGLLELVEASALAPETLAAAIDRAARKSRPSPGAINLDGAQRSAASIAKMAMEKSGDGQSGDGESAVSTMSAAWQAFFDEMARWRDAGRTAEFWWRDDDAARPDPALSRLIALAQRTSTALALAVIPMQSEKEIFENTGSLISILQHGTDHANRAGPHAKKTEFAASEPPAEAIARLAAGRRQLEAQAGKRFLPVLAPPWNRLPKHLAPHLAAAGFRGLSQYGVRSRAEASPGLRQVNTHVDIIAWRSGRGFIGEDGALAAATRHLAAKRTAAADPDEATGWLTHHAVHDEAAWAFLERLFESTRNLSAVAWRRPEELFHIS